MLLEGKWIGWRASELSQIISRVNESLSKWELSSSLCPGVIPHEANGDCMTLQQMNSHWIHWFDLKD